MTVLVNGRSIVHRGSDGTLTTVSVNLTGENRVPTPYTNIAVTSDLANTCINVTVDNHPTATMRSYIKCSRGDEPGQHGGIHSGTVNGKAEFLTHSPDVFINGSPVIRANDLAVSNQRNTDPAPILQQSGASFSRCHIEKLLATTPTPSAYQFSYQCLDLTIQGCSHCYLGLKNKRLRYISHCDSIGVSQQRTREITLENIEPGQYDVCLAIPSDDQQTILIPLPMSIHARHQSEPQWAEETLLFATQCVIDTTIDADNELVSLLHYQPVTRQAAYHHPLHAQWLGDQQQTCRNGWIYIFLQGECWRELYCDEFGAYHEVDWHSQTGQDHRRASGVAAATMILPARLNGIKPTLHVAFSTRQWSWARWQYIKARVEQRCYRIDRHQAHIAINTLQTCFEHAITDAEHEPLPRLTAFIERCLTKTDYLADYFSREDQHYGAAFALLTRALTFMPTTIINAIATRQHPLHQLLIPNTCAIDHYQSATPLPDFIDVPSIDNDTNNDGSGIFCPQRFANTFAHQHGAKPLYQSLAKLVKCFHPHNKLTLALAHMTNDTYLNAIGSKIPTTTPIATYDNPWEDLWEQLF